MGNRAVIAAKRESCLTGYDPHEVGVYLHWNGGRDSVEAFLTYCKIHGYRSPDRDGYGWASLVGCITNFFADGMSCDVGPVQCLDCDNGDNGLYLIQNWDIVDRQFHSGPEQQEYPLLDMLKAIDKAQPKAMQLGEDKIEEYCSPKEE